MGSILLVALLAIFKGAYSLPEVECLYNGKIPFRWKIDVPRVTIPPFEGSTVVPTDRKLCWKKIMQAQPYPFRTKGGVSWEGDLATDNWLRGDFGDSIMLTVNMCDQNPSCVMYWFNSKQSDQGYTSTYMKYRPQLIKVGGDVPATDYMKIKMYLTDADCALSIEELAAKGMTQWYPEGGYFHVIQDADGMLKYEGTGQLLYNETKMTDQIYSY